jgi:hypothetical protein
MLALDFAFLYSKQTLLLDLKGRRSRDCSLSPSGKVRLEENETLKRRHWFGNCHCGPAKEQGASE